MAHQQDMAEDIRRHYEAGSLQADLLDKVRIAIGLDDITPSSLALMDHFHLGGAAASAQLAAMAKPQPGEHVLDAGSGLGGPSRFLAQTYGCLVTGVDLSPQFVAVAQHLSQRLGTTDKVTYRIGNLIDINLPDGSFDLIWCEHVAMNINDRPALYRQFRRLLRTGGHLAFYDVVTGDGDPIYPTPWAETANASHLLSAEATLSALEATGLHVSKAEDVTQEAMSRQAASAGAPAAPSQPDLGLIMGPRMREMAANFAANIMQGRVRLLMGIAVAV